jgi:hypothetical protein
VEPLFFTRKETWKMGEEIEGVNRQALKYYWSKIDRAIVENDMSGAVAWARVACLMDRRWLAKSLRANVLDIHGGAWPMSEVIAAVENGGGSHGSQ